MGKRQTRRSVSLSASAFRRLRAYCEALGIPMARWLDKQIAALPSEATSKRMDRPPQYVALSADLPAARPDRKAREFRVQDSGYEWEVSYPEVMQSVREHVKATGKPISADIFEVADRFIGEAKPARGAALRAAQDAGYRAAAERRARPRKPPAAAPGPRDGQDDPARSGRGGSRVKVARAKREERW